MNLKQDNSNKFKLAWGIHRGTMMSRDIGDPYYFETEKEVIDKLESLKKNYSEAPFPCYIWYATIYRPDGTSEQLYSTPYRD